VTPQQMELVLELQQLGLQQVGQVVVSQVLQQLV
jgi:hypothetical protein